MSFMDYILVLAIVILPVLGYNALVYWLYKDEGVVLPFGLLVIGDGDEESKL